MKPSQTPWKRQQLEKACNGYADWQTYAIRDAGNHCIAVIGAVDHATAEHNRHNAVIMERAHDMFNVLLDIAGTCQPVDFLILKQRARIILSEIRSELI